MILVNLLWSCINLSINRCLDFDIKTSSAAACRGAVEFQLDSAFLSLLSVPARQLFSLARGGRVMDECAGAAPVREGFRESRGMRVLAFIIPSARMKRALTNGGRQRKARALINEFHVKYRDHPSLIIAEERECERAGQIAIHTQHCIMNA